MPKSRLAFLPVVACMCVAACSDNPFAARDAAPHRPRFDGGHMLGSGAVVDSASTTKTPTAATLDAAAADTTRRGGHMLGSGA